MNLFGQLVGLLGRVIGPTQGLYLHTGQHNTEKRGHTSMPRVGFEPSVRASGGSACLRPRLALKLSILYKAKSQ
jgi:hypothetical protein